VYVAVYTNILVTASFLPVIDQSYFLTWPKQQLLQGPQRGEL